MRKIFLILVSLFLTIGAHAITLFPYFVDVAGDYRDGTDPKFTEMNLTTQHFRVNPSFYKTISEAEEFLTETLPFSNYKIGKDTETLADGTKIIKYSSSLSDGTFGTDNTMDGKMSVIYLIQSPDGTLYIGIYEDTP